MQESIEDALKAARDISAVILGLDDEKDVDLFFEKMHENLLQERIQAALNDSEIVGETDRGYIVRQVTAFAGVQEFIIPKAKETD